VRFDLARLLMQRRQWTDAEAQLLAALETVPTYAAATLELAALRRHTGRQREAVLLLVELLERDSYNFDALIVLGETMLEQGRKTDAARAFRRVLAFDPDHVAAILYDGVMLADQRRFRAAIARWARVVELQPTGAHADRARRESRTAADLLKVFGDRLGAA
jgi:tetratricopeptide (TPR) repeat protein